MNTDLCREQDPWVRMAAGRSMQPPPTGFMKMVMLVTRMFRVLGVTSHPLLAFTLTSSPVLILSFCQTNVSATYSLFFWFCPDTFPCSIQKASVSPLKSCSLRIIISPTLPTSHPRNRSCCVPHHCTENLERRVWMSRLSPWPEGRATKSSHANLVLDTLKSVLRAHSLWSWKFTKCYRKLNLDDAATLFSVQYIFNWRGFFRGKPYLLQDIMLVKSNWILHRALKERFEDIIWTWFGYLRKHKFDQTFLYMKYTLTHITYWKKIEAIQMLWFKIASSSHWLRNVICCVMTLQTTEHGLIDLKGDFNDLT